MSQASLIEGKELDWCSFNCMLPGFLISIHFLWKYLLNISILFGANFFSCFFVPIRDATHEASLTAAEASCWLAMGERSGLILEPECRGLWMSAQGVLATAGQRKPLTILVRAVKYWKTMIYSGIGNSVQCGLGWKKWFGSLLRWFRGIIETRSWIMAMGTERMGFTKRHSKEII